MRITDDLVEAGKKFILMEELSLYMLAPGGPAWADYEAKELLGLEDRPGLHRRQPGPRDLPQRHRPHRQHRGAPWRPRTAGAALLALHLGKGAAALFLDGEASTARLDEGTGEGRVVFDLTAHSVARSRSRSS